MHFNSKNLLSPIIYFRILEDSSPAGSEVVPQQEKKYWYHEKCLLWHFLALTEKSLRRPYFVCPGNTCRGHLQFYEPKIKGVPLSVFWWFLKTESRKLLLWTHEVLISDSMRRFFWSLEEESVGEHCCCL